MSEALTRINTCMRSKSDTFDVSTQDHARFAALDAMGALTDLGPYLEPFPDWLTDYEEDVPEKYRHMWNVPKGPAPPGYIAALQKYAHPVSAGRSSSCRCASCPGW